MLGDGEHLPRIRAGDRAADGCMDMRCQSALRLDRGEVLQVVAGETAQVMYEAVEQRGEVDRIGPEPGGPVLTCGGSEGCLAWTLPCWKLVNWGDSGK